MAATVHPFVAGGLTEQAFPRLMAPDRGSVAQFADWRAPKARPSIELAEPSFDRAELERLATFFRILLEWDDARRCATTVEKKAG